MAEKLAKRIEVFYNSSDLAQQIAKPLKEGAVAEVQFEGDPDSYMMIKEGGKSVFRKGKPGKPEIYMKYSKGAVDYLLDVKGTDKKAMEEYVTRFSECILNPTDQRKIEFKLCTNVLTGARMGYFGMMLLGGKKAVKLITKLGIKIPARYLSQTKGDAP
jgi:hypothetical protein